MLSVKSTSNHFLSPEDAERPKDPLPLPPRLVKRKTHRPSSPVVFMNAEKLPKSLPPINTMRSTSPKLARKRGSAHHVPLTPPPSTSSRMGFSKSHCQLSLICENEDEQEEADQTVRGAVSCPNSPLMGRRFTIQHKPISPGAFDRAWTVNMSKCNADSNFENFNNNEANTKNDKNEQNKKTNSNARKFVLPEIIVQ
ncbi:uncharacterized protein LOC144359607 [Saccoglossus kowalevskii]